MKLRDAAAILYPLSDVSGPTFNPSACNCSRYETCDFCKAEAAKDGIAEPDAAVEAFTRTMEPKREDESC